MKRINCLERLLVEERLKVHAAEKREAFTDIAPSLIMDDTGLHSREKEILRKEVAISRISISHVFFLIHMFLL